MIEHNNKVHLPPFYLFILIWLSISKRWLSNIFFTPISCKHSQLNKNLLTPLPLPANTLIFLLSEQNALLELLIIMSPIFISPIFSLTYPSFWPFLLCYWKTINIKVSNDWWLLIQWSVLTPGLIWPVRSIWHSWSLHLFHGLILESLLGWFLLSALTS